MLSICFYLPSTVSGANFLFELIRLTQRSGQFDNYTSFEIVKMCQEIIFADFFIMPILWLIYF